ncbi:Stk1 family PASTA domain-containing Ser/Thr kinase [Leucobacter sp. W1153]|uniref:Stk1 family PASTA domain-containing Ser/Thr kinase n=1 Tax=Leucobacter sp. W1153 TaxID=3439064 RepID=UPI003F373BB8
MNSVPTDPLIGHTLDERYVIRSRIARGGMAMVYLGNDLRLERRVAIKIMHPHLAEDESFTRRFEQEARSAAGLGHPNVVNVFDQGVDRGVPYLVMEYLPGITLRELLKQQKRLTIDQAIEIGEAVLAGLAAAHAAGIVHRDLKPENVLLADDGRIKIGDFGLARAVSANTTTGQALLGTIAYLSPELVTRGVADARSDLYAFGIVMFEMLTGQQPYQGEQPMQIAYQHAHSEVPAPSTLAPEIGEEIDDLVRWCCQREPDSRPRDASEALEQFRRVWEGGTPNTTRVLPTAGFSGITITPSTAVLTDLEQRNLLAANPAAPIAGERSPSDADSVFRARAAGVRRTRRGRWVALLVVMLLALAGIAGWWWGQGPGSQVAIPEVAGSDLAAAQLALEELSLVVSIIDCSRLEVEPGLAAGTEPAADTRVDRGSAVQLCRSTGPQSLAVPTLVGLPTDDAIAAIEAAGFTFGEVLEQRFDGGGANTVIAALGESGEGLGQTYPERSRVDLIVSAGAIPEVRGMDPDAVATMLQAVGLTLDPSLNTEEYNDEIPEGRAIGVLVFTDPVRVGDSVGVSLSRGPQLFAVPDVSGMNVNEAAEALRAAGFSVSTGIVPEGPAGTLFEVKSTSPAAGEMRRAGTEIALRYI